MRIIWDATALYGRFGGIENAIWHTLEQLALVDEKNDYLICVPADAPDAPAFVDERFVWHRLPFRGSQKARRILWQQLELPLLLKRERADLLHALTYVAPLHCPVPFVLGIPDLIALNRPRFATRANRIHYRAIMPQSLKNAARIIVTTPRVGREVKQRVRGAKVRVAPLGVEPLFFEPISREQLEFVRLKYDLPPQFVLYVGNFEPKKNLPNLLRALKSLPDAPPLVIAGGIKAWPGFEHLLRDVQKLGFIERADLPALYASCEAFCFPSACEGFGLPVLESLAVGAKTLASTQVPLPELNSVAARPNPRFPRSIAAELQSLLVDENHFVETRRNYAREFTWERTARATLAVYEELRLSPEFIAGKL